MISFFVGVWILAILLTIGGFAFTRTIDKSVKDPGNPKPNRSFKSYLRDPSTWFVTGASLMIILSILALF